ncbi:hypothetical protein B0H11DRAFT_2263077 [Mycena galericulata]|nr:hypothetical protein B0H11DRAFT_2263077 [Mycena galericulata]
MSPAAASASIGSGCSLRGWYLAVCAYREWLQIPFAPTTLDLLGKHCDSQQRLAPP